MTHICECYKKTYYLDTLNKTDSADWEDDQEYFGEYSISLEKEKAVKLPGVIYLNDASAFPDTQNSDLPHLFQAMAEIITGVKDYESNILSFWIIDVFLEGLRTAQIAKMNHKNQKTTLQWIIYMYNLIQDCGNKFGRRELLLKIKMLLLAAPENDEVLLGEASESKSKSAYENKYWEIPLPPPRPTADKFIPSEQNIIRDSDAEVEPPLDSRDSEENVIGTSEQNLHYMKIILGILYRIYARLWTFTLIQRSLCSTPGIEVVDLPYTLNVPKQLLKYDNTSQIKSDKGTRKTISRNNSEEGTSFRKSMRSSDYILPLQDAEGIENFFRELFGPSSFDVGLSDRDKGKSDKRKK